MENCSHPESAGSDAAHRTAVVGLGNPLHGDDGVGVAVAQWVFRILRHEFSVDLLEWPILDARLAERLIGYRRAVIVDALTDVRGKVGTVRRVDIAGGSGNPALSLHTAGFHHILALAQMVGMVVPRQIAIYGIVVGKCDEFRQGLSRKIRARVPDIVMNVASEELQHARKLGVAKSLRSSRSERRGDFAEMVKRPP